MVHRLLFFIFLISSGCGVQSTFINSNYHSVLPYVSQDSVSQTIFLIGDAGEPVSKGTEPTFRILTQQALQRPSVSTIIFLGDNIYPRGLPESNAPERKEMERRLNEQIGIAVLSGAGAIFIPGNHDWEYQGKNGRRALLREEEYIASQHHPNVTLLPKQGSPGPAVVDIDDVRIVAIDTQWWLHPFDKPLYPDDTSEIQTKKRFIDSLSRVLNAPQPRNIIVVAHHPLETYGEHGGFFDWKDHLFPLRKVASWLWIPLPGIGSLYPLSRMWGISDQDLSGRRNIEMRSALDSVISHSYALAYAAGHEHVLEVLAKSAKQYLLVSGKGIQKHSEALTTGEQTIFASRRQGFMRLDFLKNGNVRLGVTDTSEGEGREIFSMMLR